MRLGVFGNCQATGIADCLRALRPEDDVTHLAAPDIARMKPRGVVAAKRELLASDVLMLQAAVTHPMARELETAFAQQKTLVVLPVLATHAFHPDCHYVRDGEGALVNSPIGHYHSALIAGAFIAGLREERIAPLFNRFVYEKLGYRQSEARKAEFFSRSMALGFDLRPAGEQLGVFMHSVNHPKVGLLDALARQALDRVGLRVREGAPLPPDKLEKDGVFPVYPGLGVANAQDPVTFCNTKNGRAFSLEEFVAGTCARLGERPAPLRTKLAPMVREMIEAHVIA